MAVAVATITMAPVLALAKGNHPMAGCGLGYVLLSNKDNSKVTQVLGATTNGTSGNQTFGISSGTSGCTEDGAVKIVKAAEVYADVNLDSLRREMATGEGEYVRTFALLLGASQQNVSPLVSVFRSEYPTLFPSATTSTADLLASLEKVLNQHKDLLS
ncbi:MAG: hypothetical protein KCHDKBKB_01990 [Elusimicrobia bacterium]|nr:hypothetical protein [Elusimicrobiota bacterium]